MIFCGSPAAAEVEPIPSLNQRVSSAWWCVLLTITISKRQTYNGSLHVSHATDYKTSLDAHYLPAVTAGIGEVVEKEGVLFTVFPERVASSWVSWIGRQRGNGNGEGEWLRGSIPIHSSKVWYPLSTELRREQILVAVKESVDAPFP